MQADGSVVVSDLGVFYSLTNAVYGGLLVAHLYSTQPTHSLYAFRLPLMFRNVTKTIHATTERSSEERTVKDTHHPC